MANKWQKSENKNIAQKCERMCEALMPSVEECFGNISDPRVRERCNHKLLVIIIIVACCVITGVESWVEIETFGKEREDWLRSFLELAGGIPAHDTFGRVFAMLDAEAV